MPIDDAERHARLRLIRTPGLGPHSFHQLLARFGSAREALGQLPKVRNRAGRPWIAPSPGSIDRELDRLETLGARLLFAGIPPYPAALATLADAPPVLAAIGRLSWLGRPLIALVGARNASAAGMHIAGDIAQELTGAGFTVVSGLARGIDGAAHRAALPSTIAVVAHGPGRCFPPEHEELQARIMAEGLLLSEAAPDAEPFARAFPARNRIIAGLALGTVIVEATLHSGSLITARLATEAGREVMAVPGHPLEPRAQGPNSLIREGATLVQGAADILDALGPLDPRMATSPASSPPTSLFPTPSSSCIPAPMIHMQANAGQDTDLLRLIGTVPLDADDLVQLSGWPADAVNRSLVRLELAGTIARQPGGRIARC